MRSFVAAAVVAAAALSSRDARAVCEAPTYETFEVDPSQVGLDQIPPELPQIESLWVDRGNGWPFESECGGLGWISFRVVTSDDTTAYDGLGFRARVTQGTPPAGLTGLDGTFRANQGDLTFMWTDEVAATQESIDFTLAITALDAAGNESAPVEVRIAHPGGFGCTSAGAGLLALLPLLALRRRRTA